MIRIQYFQNGCQVDCTPTTAEIESALSDASGMLWVDFQGEPQETCEPILLQAFKFHPLAIEDALRQTHVPKVDEWEQYLYIALHAITLEPDADDLELIELDIFLGENYLVTHHDLPIPTLDHVWRTFQQEDRHRKSGVDHILYLVTDHLTADFMHTVEVLDEEIEEIEDRIFSKPNNQLVQKVFTLKRVTMHLRRSLSPMREVLNKLARDDFSQIDARDRIYFRDVYDHLVRLHDIAEGLRDLVGGVLDTYLSVVNNRMNDIMKTLTLITTLFMPISFVAGFFGMNFFQPTSARLIPWTDNTAFLLTMALVVLPPFGMFLWMRRRGWMR
jgi:magnesium transporter